MSDSEANQEANVSEDLVPQEGPKFAASLSKETDFQGALGKSISVPHLKKKVLRSPLRCPLPYNKPLTDKWGFPKSLESPPPAEPWDVRHHLQGMPNDVVPKERRTYFSKPQSLAELEVELTNNPASASMLKRIQSGDLPGRPRSIISCDAGAPVCPERHVFGGTMLDRDGMGRTWNNRWHTGIAMLNEHCHPDHRTYFTQRSLFERSPSQVYRRFLHQERRPGEWVSIDQRRPAKFPPLGGYLTGRSGAPIPGATP